MLAFSSADALSLKRTYAGSSFFDGFNFKPVSAFPIGDTAPLMHTLARVMS